jgi:hypothetical protein
MHLDQASSGASQQPVANCEWWKIMIARLLSPETRQRIAKHAATIRWRDVKARPRTHAQKRLHLGFGSLIIALGRGS